jgi:ribosomal protein S18 acetylase RimI-like enzyme
MTRRCHLVSFLYACSFFQGTFLVKDAFTSLLVGGFSTSSVDVLRKRSPHVFQSRRIETDSPDKKSGFINNVEYITKENPCIRYQIRDCTHQELSSVADLIVDSFYNYSTANTVWKQFTKLAELNRIQQNFPYGDDRAVHRMMVLTTTERNATTSKICGFVDVDARIPNRPTSYKYNPRPYLSDLCIHPHYRRYGYATLLIQACEAFCLYELPQVALSPAGNFRTDISAVSELYIRVETSNVAAEQMYRKLGYNIVRNHSDARNDKIMILHKRL